MAPGIKTLIKTGKIKAHVNAGGWGGRLAAIPCPTRHASPLAKGAVPIGMFSAAQYALRAVKGLGMTKATLSVWHLPETISEAVSLNGLDLTFISERPQDPLDTAAPIARIARKRGWDSINDNVILSQACDIVHEIPLENITERFLQSKASAMILVRRYPWDQIERFGSVRLERMPKRSKYQSDSEFETAVDDWNEKHRGTSQRIIEFREKMPRTNATDPNETCLSNLVYTSIFIFEIALLKTLMTLMTKKSGSPLFPDLYKSGGPHHFSDWGSHIFRWLTLPQNRRRFPLHAFVLPPEFYWRDIGYGEDILRANMDALDEEFNAGFGQLEKQAGNWGWRGKNVYVDETATVKRSMIADNCIIGPHATITKSVVRENTMVNAGAVLDHSVVFPRPSGRSEPNIIGEGVTLRESLFLGGEISPETTFVKKMVYTPVGGVAIDSLFKKTEVP